MNTQAILKYISSSEHNRCKRNGLSLFQPREYWYDVLKYDWLTRKLRRKIGHLLQMDLLPVIYKPPIGIYTSDPIYKDLGMRMLKKYLDAEDELIMKGLPK